VEVAVGTGQACARKSDGTAWCWGYNGLGELGDGTNTSRPTPVQVTALGNGVVQIAASWQAACARKSDGTLWCWGSNVAGQLGDGSGSNHSSPVQITALGTGVAQIAMASGRACARKSDGTLWCWGAGPVGDGSTANKATPVQVTSLGTSVAQVAVGDSHICARKNDGTLWCWGQNGYGQLGDTNTAPHLTPVQVMGLGGAIIDVAAGNIHTCAVRNDGTGWCWGNNDWGQLGDGTLTGHVAPTQVTTTALASVTAAATFTCARKTTGTLVCWGDGGYGQLGDGTGTSRPAGATVSLLGNTVSGVAVRGGETCAVRADGTLWCWGDNRYGQLGDGSSLVGRPLPMRLPLGVCASDACNNGLKDGSESDVDCGGSCLAYGLICVDGKRCGAAADCSITSVCNTSLTCATTCSNGVLDPTESDVDCGAFCVNGCWNAQHCNTEADCVEEANCVDNVCEI
jgi:alpha-tubulin suppressor-like RCC1 family protein